MILDDTLYGNLAQQLAAMFGTTEDPDRGVFLLPNGQLVDGGGPQRPAHQILLGRAVRQSPHGAATEVGVPYDAMYRMLVDQRIARWLSEGHIVELVCPPTQAQIRTIKEAIVTWCARGITPLALSCSDGQPGVGRRECGMMCGENDEDRAEVFIRGFYLRISAAFAP